MANSSVNTIRIQGVDGDVVDVTSNALDVNIASGTADIDIGDVSLLLDGTAADYGTGNVNTSGRTLRVTLASDDTLGGTIYQDDADWSNGSSKHILVGGVYASGAMSITDGDVSPLLLGAQGGLIIDVLNGGVLETYVDGIETHLAAIEAAVELSDNVVVYEDNPFVPGSPGTYILAVRQAALASSTSHDGDHSSFKTNTVGALYVSGSERENIPVQGQPHLMGGRYDSSARTLGDGDAGAVALNASGHVIMDVVDGGVLESVLDEVEGSLSSVAITSLSASTNLALYLPLLATIDADTNTMQGNLINIGNAIYADDDSWTNDSSKHILVGGLYQSSMQSVTDGDVAPFQVDANGVLRTSHSITGMQSDSKEDVDDSTAEVLKSSTACKRVDMQADSANTGYIYVGGSDVSATKGIRLAPGDFYSIDCDNTADIYVLASVDEEDIHFTYYT